MNINRYTNVSTSDFNPLSMQEMFTVPLAKQKKHDETQAKLDELGLFDINRLEQDNEVANNFIEGYKTDVNKQVDQMMEQGVNNSSVRGVRDLINRRHKWLSKGNEGGNIEANYNKFHEYKKSLDASLQKGEITAQHHEALLNNSTKDYRNVNDGNLNTMAQAKTVDAAKYLRPFAVDMMNNPTIVEQYTGLIPLGNGMYKYDKTTEAFVNPSYRNSNGVITEKHAIQIALGNIAKGNDQLMGYLNQKVDLGLSKSADNEIQNITSTMDAMYDVDKRGIDRRVGNYPVPKTTGDSEKKDKVNLPPLENIYSGLGSQRPFFGDIKTAQDVEDLMAQKEMDGDIAGKRRIETHYEAVKQVQKNSKFGQYYHNRMYGYEENNLGLPTNGFINDISKMQGIENQINIGTGAAPQAEIVTNKFTEEQLFDGINGENGYSIRKTDKGYRLYKESTGRDRIAASGNARRGVTSNPQQPGRLAVNLPEDFINKAKSIARDYKRYQEGLNKKLRTYNKQNVEYNITDLKPTDRTVLNKDLKSVVSNYGVNEFRIEDATFIDNENNTSRNLKGYDKAGIGTGAWLTGDNSEKDQKQLFNLFKDPNTTVEFLSYISKNHTGVPSMKVRVTPDKTNNHFGANTLEMTIDLGNLSTNGTSVQAADQLILNKFEKLGGESGKALAKKGKQRIKYKDIEPGFFNDFELSDKIKAHISNAQLQPYLSKVDLDINMIGDKYVMDIRNPETGDTQTLGWADLVQPSNDKTMLESVRQLSPAIARKLVIDIKQMIPNFDNATDEQINESIKLLVDNNASINMEDYYDLLDLLSK